MLRLRHYVCACLAAALLLTGIVPAAAATDEQRQQLRELQELRDQNQGRLDRIRVEVEAARGEYKRYNSELARAEQDLYYFTNELAFLESQLAGVQLQVDAATEDLNRVQAELDTRTEYVNTRLRVLAEMGTLSYLEVLLSATSFSDFITRFDLISELLTKDMQTMQEVNYLRDQVASRKSDLDAKQADLAALRRETEVKRASVASLANDVAARKAQAAEDLAFLEQQEEEFLRISDQLNDQILALQQAMGREAKAGLAMIWPVRGPITSYFGLRPDPFTGVWKNHSGMDIAAPSGTPIKAAEDGLVIHSGWIDGYGYTIIIDHGGGIATLYGHASRLIAQAGQEVVQGEVVAHVGSTGYSTGPHLHFEVRVNGVRVEPLDYLPQ